MISFANQTARSQPASNRQTGLFGCWKRVASDSLSLAGLQLKLFKVDVAQWLWRIRFAIALLAVGTALAVGALTLLLLAGVVGLTMAGLHQIWSLVIVGGAALLIGGVLVSFAIGRLARANNSFDRSQSELDENLNWLQDQFSDGQNQSP